MSKRPANTTPNETAPAARALVWRRLDAIRPAVRNPRIHDLDALIAAILRFGFVAPPVEDVRTGRLVAGHGRTEALREIQRRGLPAPEGVADFASTGGGWLVPVYRAAFSSPAEAEAYLLADNRQGELSHWDYDGLRDVLEDLARADAATDLGWSEGTLERMFAPPEDEPEEREDEPEERTRQLTITYGVEAFAALLPRLAAAQRRTRTTTYAGLLDALLAMSEAA